MDPRLARPHTDPAQPGLLVEAVPILPELRTGVVVLRALAM
jgi:hypothetical protein